MAYNLIRQMMDVVAEDIASYQREIASLKKRIQELENRGNGAILEKVFGPKGSDSSRTSGPAEEAKEVAKEGPKGLVLEPPPRKASVRAPPKVKEVVEAVKEREKEKEGPKEEERSVSRRKTPAEYQADYRRRKALERALAKE